MQQPLPKIRNDLRFIPAHEKGESWYVIEDAIRHQFYRIGVEEYLFISRLNRFSTLTDLLADLVTETHISLSEQQSRTILSWLANRQLLSHDDPGFLRQLSLREQEQAQQRKVNRLNLISFKIPLFNPNRILQSIGSRLNWLTGKTVFVLWLLLGFLAVSTLTDQWAAFQHQSTGFFSPINLVWIWLIWFGLKILHELFHALTCQRYGGEVYEAGLLFILLIPLTYVNATSSWRFSSKWQRIHVAVAGIYIELLAAFIAILVWAHSQDSTIGLIAHNTVLIAGVSSLFFNANPLMRFDGYYVLSDLKGIPNLYFLGLQDIRSLLARFFLGVKPPPLHLERNKIFIRLYGIAASIWRVLVMVSLLWIASKMAGGFGLPAALAASLVTLVFPLVRFIQTLLRDSKNNPGILKRFCLTGGLVTFCIAFVLLCGSLQEHIQAPGVIEYRRQYNVRTGTAGICSSGFGLRRPDREQR